ncbi:MAG: hypothetical protein HRU11_12315 [Parvularculaceae bacterium]|nr:hypothetical protein [Parvularculaceae bacterium]
MAQAVRVPYVASPTGREFHASTAKVRGVMGPVGSGKSTMNIVEMMMLAMLQWPDKWGQRTSRWLIVRETYPQLRNTVFESFKLWLRPNGTTVKYVESAPMRIKWTDKLPDGTKLNAEFVFLAVSKPEDLENIKSFEITGAFVNEAGALDYDVITTVGTRIGRYPPPVEAVDPDNPIRQTALLFDSNPPDEDSWMGEVFKNVPRGWEVWKQPAAVLEDPESDIGYKLNPMGENFKYLGVGPVEYYLDKVSAMTKEQIRVLFQGEFGVTTDGKAVYRRQWADDMHVAKSNLKLVKNMPVILGWDWGKGGESCVIAQKTQSGQLRVIEEIVADNVGLEDFARNFVKPRLEKLCPKKDGWKIESIGDPSGKASHGLSKDGLNYFDILNNSRYGLFHGWFDTVPARSNHIELRLNAVRYFLTEKTATGAPKFQLDRSCSKMRRGFNAGYVYKRMQVSGQARYKDQPDKNDFSHPQDALQYIALHLHPNYKTLKQHTEFVTRAAVDEITNY